jgi:hypothetical protein
MRMECSWTGAEIHPAMVVDLQIDSTGGLIYGYCDTGVLKNST